MWDFHRRLIGGFMRRILCLGYIALFRVYQCSWDLFFRNWLRRKAYLSSPKWQAKDCTCQNKALSVLHPTFFWFLMDHPFTRLLFFLAVSVKSPFLQLRQWEHAFQNDADATNALLFSETALRPVVWQNSHRRQLWWSTSVSLSVAVVSRSFSLLRDQRGRSSALASILDISAPRFW